MDKDKKKSPPRQESNAEKSLKQHRQLLEILQNFINQNAGRPIVKTNSRNIDFSNLPDVSSLLVPPTRSSNGKNRVSTPYPSTPADSYESFSRAPSSSSSLNVAYPSTSRDPDPKPVQRKYSRVLKPVRDESEPASTLTCCHGSDAHGHQSRCLGAIPKPRPIVKTSHCENPKKSRNAQRKDPGSSETSLSKRPLSILKRTSSEDISSAIKSRNEDGNKEKAASWRRELSEWSIDRPATWPRRPREPSEDDIEAWTRGRLPEAVEVEERATARPTERQLPTVQEEAAAYLRETQLNTEREGSARPNEGDRVWPGRHIEPTWNVAATWPARSEQDVDEAVLSAMWSRGQSEQSLDEAAWSTEPPQGTLDEAAAFPEQPVVENAVPLIPLYEIVYINNSEIRVNRLDTEVDPNAAQRPFTFVESDYYLRAVFLDDECVEELGNQRTTECPLPEALGSFSLRGLIGRGNFANVYRVLDRTSSLMLALKIYRMWQLGDNRFSRVSKEIAFLRILRHPNIITYSCSDLTKVCMYIAIEYSEHGSLKNFMVENQCMAQSKVQSILKNLFSALHYLHSMYIVHGDINPDNVIVSEVTPIFLKVKLADFGFADTVPKSEKVRPKCGSFLYMAPELHLGLPADCTTDHYSVGVLAYELLYGIKPYPVNVTKEEFIDNFSPEYRIPYPQTETPLSEDCVNLVKALLSIEKDRRPSGQALLDHPFLNITPSNLDEQDHYHEGYRCFLRAAQHTSDVRYGLAYVEMTTAIVHLTIHSNRVVDRGLHLYITKKVDDYKRYCNFVEERLRTDNSNVLTLDRDSERLRVVLYNVPEIRDAFDYCEAGEMYFYLKNFQRAEQYFKKGIDVVIAHLYNESDGKKKEMLQKKVEEWNRLLQIIQGRTKNRNEVTDNK